MGKAQQKKQRVLTEEFFNRPALVVAKELLGKNLVRKKGSKEYRYKITETEAYVGPDDKASHAYKGRTPRTDVMFGPPGTLYIYFVYGVYHMLNVVTGKDGYPAAVLIRGTDQIEGPGRLTKKLGITKKENGVLAHPQHSKLWFEEGEEKVNPKKIKRTPRVGIAYAKEWKDKPYRFVLSK